MKIVIYNVKGKGHDLSMHDDIINE